MITFMQKITILMLICLLPMSLGAQTYQYEHKLRPKQSPNASFYQFSENTSSTFMELYRTAGKPKILILFEQKAIQDMGGLETLNIQEIDLTKEKNISYNGAFDLSVEDATSSADAAGSISGKGQKQSHALVTFKYFVPTAAKDWLPERIGGFDRQLLEGALAAPLIDAGAILVDRQTALDFHAEEIFSAMKQDRLEAQRDVLKKIADLILNIHVANVKEKITKVSGDEEIIVLALSARILSIKDARIVNVVSNRSVSRLIDAYGFNRANPEIRMEILSYVVMNQLIENWKRGR